MLMTSLLCHIIYHSMHNIIQELRGNVRVFARVRPFLPDDRKQGEEDDAPSVSHEGDTIITVVSSVQAVLLQSLFTQRSFYQTSYLTS